MSLCLSRPMVNTALQGFLQGFEFTLYETVAAIYHHATARLFLPVKMHNKVIAMPHYLLQQEQNHSGF